MTTTKYWCESECWEEDGSQVIRWLIDGEVTKIYGPDTFELVAEGRRFFCDRTRVIEPKPSKIEVGKRYSIHGVITGKEVNGAEELWLIRVSGEITHKDKEKRQLERELELISYGGELPFEEYQLDLLEGVK